MVPVTVMVPADDVIAEPNEALLDPETHYRAGSDVPRPVDGADRWLAAVVGSASRDGAGWSLMNNPIAATTTTTRAITLARIHRHQCRLRGLFALRADVPCSVPKVIVEHPRWVSVAGRRWQRACCPGWDRGRLERPGSGRRWRQRPPWARAGRRGGAPALRPLRRAPVALLAEHRHQVPLTVRVGHPEREADGPS